MIKRFCGIRQKERHSEKGNIFAMVMGGIVLSGVLSAAVYQLMSGPMTSTVRLAKITAAESQEALSARTIIVDAVNQTSADCDSDGAIEPRAWAISTDVDATGDIGGSHPATGGYLPLAAGAATKDPWGTDYHYCVWDVGGFNDPATENGCGAAVNRLQGSNAPLAGDSVSQTVFAIISAGPNRTYETTCNAYTDGTTDVITPGGDDIIKRYTYAEAAEVAPTDWNMDLGALETATIDKNLQVGDGVTGGAINAQSLNVRGKIAAGGPVILGMNDSVTVCDAGHAGLMRYNPGINIEQFDQDTQSSATSATANLSSPAVGNSIIVFVTQKGSSVTGVSDTSNTYTQQAVENTGCAGMTTHIYSAPIVTSQNNITANTAGAADISILAMEVSGLDAPTADVSGNTTSGATTSTTVTGAGTINDPKQIVLFGLSGCPNADASSFAIPAASGALVDKETEVATTATTFIVGQRILTNMTAAGQADSDISHANTFTNSQGVLATFPAGSGAEDVGFIEFCDGGSYGAVNSAGADEINELSDGYANYTAGWKNVGLGQGALGSAEAASWLGQDNTAVGKDALALLTGASGTEDDNTAIGHYVMDTPTGGTGNTAAGYEALTSAQTSNPANVTALGYRAMASAGATALSGNTAVGVSAQDSDPGTQQTSIGYMSGGESAAYGTHIGNYSGMQARTTLTAIGHQALVRHSGSTAGNTAVGHYALFLDEEGSENTAVGYRAGEELTTDGNTIFGDDIFPETVREESVLIGSSNMNALTRGVAIGLGANAGLSNSVTIGYQALNVPGLTTEQVAVGYQALENPAANSNVAIGHQALEDTGTSGGWTAVGQNALAGGAVGFNVAIGARASETSASSVAVGYLAAPDGNLTGVAVGSSTGTGDVAVGVNALNADDTAGGDNVAIGVNAMDQAANTTNRAVAIGYNALRKANNATSDSVAIGVNALPENTTGANNYAVGYDALSLNVTGDDNIAVGWSALKNNTTSDNIAIGTEALEAMDSGQYNVAVGVRAMEAANGAGSQDNVVIGKSAAQSATTDFSNNVVIGAYALDAATSGVDDNVVIGHSAAGATVSVDDSVIVGYRTATAATSITGPVTLVGFEVADAATTLASNTAVGWRALDSVSTGSNNTVVGEEAGNAITTGSNNVAIGHYADVAATLSNQIAIGNDTTVSAANTARFGDSNVEFIAGAVGYSFASDRRLKKDIEDSDLGLDFVLDLRPVSYRMKEGNDLLNYGFLAQDVDKLLAGRKTNMVTRDNDESQTYRLSVGEIVAPLVKAIQEQQAIEKRQQKDIENLAARLQAVRVKLAAQEARQ